MGTEYELILTRDDGTEISRLNTTEGFEYTKVANLVGACSLTLPEDFDFSMLDADRKIEIWRQPESGALKCDRTYFLRKLVRATDKNGVRRFVLTGVDGNYLLAARIVAYASGSAQSQQTDYADDMVKAVVKQNLGASATDTARAFNATYFSVQADLSAGPSITKAFAYKNVIEALNDIAESSRTSGTELYFDMVPILKTATQMGFEFRTFTGQIGQDRTYPDGYNPIMLGIEYGNLAVPTVEWDWLGEISNVYAGGQGEGSAREIVTAADTTRSGRSIWARREAFQNGNNLATAALTAAANKKLAEGRARLRFTGQLVDTEGTRYGKDWEWGDRLTVIDGGQSYNAMIKAVKVRVDSKGLETIDARLEVDE